MAMLALSGMFTLGGCSDNVKSSLVRNAPVEELLSSPTGKLETGEVDRLWVLYQRMAAHWDLSGVARPDLAEFLNAKTGTAPSYLAEYRHGLDLLKSTESDGKQTDMEQVQKALAPGGDINDLATRSLERVRLYLVGEFLQLAMIKGSFKQFGLNNYRGYAAGPRTFTPARDLA